MGDFGMFFILIWVLIIWEYWVCENSLWFTYDGFSFPYVFTGTNLKGFPRNKEVFIWAFWKKEKVTATNQNIKTLKIHEFTMILKKKRNSPPKRTKKYLWSPFKERSSGMVSVLPVLTGYSLHFYYLREKSCDLHNR